MVDALVGWPYKSPFSEMPLVFTVAEISKIGMKKRRKQNVNQTIRTVAHRITVIYSFTKHNLPAYLPRTYTKVSRRTTATRVPLYPTSPTSNQPANDDSSVLVSISSMPKHYLSVLEVLRVWKANVSGFCYINLVTLCIRNQPVGDGSDEAVVTGV